MLTFSQDNIANGQSGIALWSFFNVASTATMATRFIPIPGSAITIEKVLQDFLHVSQFNYFFDQFGQPIPPNQVGENFINNGVLLYRCAVLYIPAIVGLPFFL
jgi:hypothetical protein